MGRSIREPRRRRRALALGRAAQRAPARAVHPDALRARADRRRTGCAEPAVPSVGRPRGLPPRGRRSARTSPPPAAAGRRSCSRTACAASRGRRFPTRRRSRARTAGSFRWRRARSTRGSCPRSARGSTARSRGSSRRPTSSACPRRPRRSRRRGRRDASRASGLLILGGDAAVLLLGFAVLASTRLRRDQLAVRRRLTWLGARRSQILLVTATEVAVITVAATIVGWAVGTAAGALLARHLGAPGLLAVEHSVLTWRAFAIALRARRADAIRHAHRAAHRLGRLRRREAHGRRRRRARRARSGAARARTRQGRRERAHGRRHGRRPAPASRARAVRPRRRRRTPTRAVAAGASERTGRRAPAPVRLALLSLARSPGRVVLSVVFFVLSVGIALFAIAYRSTLERGESEQARYAVPAPYVLQESLEQLVTRAAGGVGGAVRGARPDDTRCSATRGTCSATPDATSRCLRCPPRELTRVGRLALGLLGADAARARAAHRSGAACRGCAASHCRPMRAADRSDRRRRRPARRRARRPEPSRRLLDALARPARARRRTHRRCALPPAARGGRLVAMRLSFPGDRRLRRRPQGERHGSLRLGCRDRDSATRTAARRSRRAAAAPELGRRRRRSQRQAAPCTTC